MKSKIAGLIASAIVVSESLLVPRAQAQSYQSYPESQGWTQSQLRNWYELSQGSRLAPVSWLKALKHKDGSNFLSRSYLEGLGYNYFSNAPDSLPIGFIQDTNYSDPKPWLGLNCSACHTSKLKTDKAEVWVHGGQTMSDFQAFSQDLLEAITKVNTDENTFNSFASEVLDDKASDAEKSTLKKQIADWLAFHGPITNTGSDSHWGRGRADAVGVILGTTAMVVADPNIPEDQREPLPASNAPVSYPFVWNANQQARLQHNGVVDNGTNLGVVKVAKIGALIRNWTEALGVFADVKLDANNNKVNSSIRLDNLLLIEQALADLQSPAWPESFGKIDEKRQARGQVIYKAECGSCHGLLDKGDTKTYLPLLDFPSQQNERDPKGFIYLQPVFDKKTKASAFLKTHQPSYKFIGTDPGMACNALLHKVPTGRLEGQSNVEGVVPSFGDRKFSDIAVTTDLLRVLIQRDILANRSKSLLSIAENQIAAAGDMLTRYAYSTVEGYIGQDAGNDPLAPLRAELQYCATIVEAARAYAPDSPVPVYKARPLNGIWASAPYLHNGSVPTLFDLLLPQKDRPKTFGYFDGTMDTLKVGLKDASSNPNAFIFQTYDKEGFVKTGNWNGGHEYGTKLNRDQRLDLVEYLKGL